MAKGTFPDDARRFFDWGGRESHDPSIVENSSGAKKRMAAGRSLRKDVPRSAHGKWRPDPHRPDPISVLEKQAESRVPDLIPIRHGRMLASPFAFFRGAAAVMAWDLAHSATTKIRVQTCGDAHLVNFGAYAAPDRRLVFDLNDFDETLPAPFEWDIKRLAASVEVAGRDNGFAERDRQAAVRGAAVAYQQAIGMLANLRFLDTWYTRIDLEHIEKLVAATGKASGRKATEREVRKALRKTSVGALTRFAEPDGDSFRIHEEPPLITRFDATQFPNAQAIVQQGLSDYVETLSADRQILLERYRFVDFARKVVGVGSVGTEAFMVLLMGDRNDDPLFLQIKEAQESVLAPYAGATTFSHEGERVVQGQRIMQAASDSFLGWFTGTGPKRRDFYVRQLRDMKGSAEVETMDERRLKAYAELCGATLARAHARAGDAGVISGYVGNGEVLGDSIVQFATAYADQNDADHAALLAAVESGRVDADLGV